MRSNQIIEHNFEILLYTLENRIILEEVGKEWSHPGLNIWERGDHFYIERPIFLYMGPYK